METYGLKPGSTIHLMVLLSAIPTNLTKVVFDLYWGWPDSGKDYLDASALVFSGREYLGVVNYNTLARKDLEFVNGAIYHSGDRMDKVKRQGHHILKVNLKALPTSVTNVFFTLSVWKSKELSNFKNLNFRFFDEQKPDQMLCADQTKEANEKQAIVMCRLSNIDGHWYVYDSGISSEGNAKDYNPLKNTITNIIDEWQI